MASFDQPAVLFLVPGDPDQKTGGYRYVSQLVSALNLIGTDARVRGLEGCFPIPDERAFTAMDTVLSDCSDGALVVLDGLAMGGLPEAVEKHAGRLQLWSLVHHPLADETGLTRQDREFLFQAERQALALVDGVLVTSRHTSRRLREFQVSADRVYVVEPGADTVTLDRRAVRAQPGPATPQLLCVATLSPRKAQHQLVEALSGLVHLPWHCSLVGSLEREPQYAEQVRRQIIDLNLEERFTLPGELGDDALAEHYNSADCFVLPSLYEGYGMVIDEALSAGVPVISSDGGALANTGDRPGVMLYPAGSLDELRRHLERCLGSEAVLAALKADAQRSARTVRSWATAACKCAHALGIGRPEKDHSQFDLDWLILREPADHRARNQHVLGEVKEWAGERSPLKIVDLGAGAGSNGVFLSGELPTPQHWTLLDQDSVLLEQAKKRLVADQITADVEACRLDEGNLGSLISADADLITASALIDLVSEAWLQALALAARNRGAAVYIVISYAGEFRLEPEHPDDGFVRALVNQHQHGDKGGGAALGPNATGYLKHAIESHGYQVSVGPSQWHLEQADEGLQVALIRGWVEAALEQCPAETSRIRNWQSARLADAAMGTLFIQVNHDDLFAWPSYA